MAAPFWVSGILKGTGKSENRAVKIVFIDDKGK